MLFDRSGRDQGRLLSKNYLKVHIELKIFIKYLDHEQKKLSKMKYLYKWG